jgi:RNA polymerase sigma factor (sigma-70 family)
MAPDPAAEGVSARPPIPDDLLARRATKGDRRAFEAIYRRYHRDLYRFCLAMIGNAQDAQDALQNTMVKVLRALPGEKRQIQLKPWLYRIARNEAIETVRRRRDSVELGPEHGPTGIELSETAEHRERLRRLIADLEELPERQRAALVMRELAGLGFEQIGETFETSPAVARQTVYEARLSLRQMEKGREMACDQVMRALSDADGRVTRRRELRAHLRGCASCRAFGESIETRRGELAAIAPLPAALSAAMLHGILSGKASAAGLGGSAAGAGGLSGSAAGVGGGGAAGGAAAGSGAGAGIGAGGLAGTIGAGAGKAIATSAILKAAATVAVVATVGVTAADRGGLIDVPLLGGSAKSSQSSSSPPAQGEAGGATGLETQNEAAGGGRQAAGSSRAASAAGAQRGRSGATPGAGARRAGSGHRASANAHAKGRGASHRHDGLPATVNHGQSSAAPGKTGTRGASGGSTSHAPRKAHRRTPTRHSSRHAVHRPPPPKPAPPREAPTATTPTPPPAPSEPAATGASATGSTTATE